MNGTYALPEALQVDIAPVARVATAGVQRAGGDQRSRQHIGSTDPLRTGSYGKTLTFTLSTTNP